MECITNKGSIHYKVYGEGFPLIILHAMGTDHRSMKAWLEPIFTRLDGFKRVYVDIPAHGGSKIDDTVKSTEDILASVLDFIDQMDFEEYSLIGHSYGGYLAQGIVHRRSHQVKGICLIAPALHIKKRTLPENKVFRSCNHSLEQLDADVRAAYELLIVVQNELTLTRFVEEVQPGRLLANRTFLASNWRESGYFLSDPPFIQEDNMPQSMLIIVGKQDAICGYKDQLTLIEKFTHSSNIILDRAGHMLPIEKREIVQELVLDWLISNRIE
ncbi:alpha/beta hydrolase [Cytobacillus suaedae]|nr:alpha/beta hydrolase [Cytobacillus suaedae]